MGTSGMAKRKAQQRPAATTIATKASARKPNHQGRQDGPHKKRESHAEKSPAQDGKDAETLREAEDP